MSQRETVRGASMSQRRLVGRNRRGAGGCNGSMDLPEDVGGVEELDSRMEDVMRSPMVRFLDRRPSTGLQCSTALARSGGPQLSSSPSRSGISRWRADSPLLGSSPARNHGACIRPRNNPCAGDIIGVFAKRVSCVGHHLFNRPQIVPLPTEVRGNSWDILGITSVISLARR